ncbi:MAG TPA: hypothetical protein PL151_06525 [Phycisphaerae bacterium]|nr:hypothetical protein [Phycisphaerae bacterium]HOJ73762.1 hypothetical protein [Phycisphaerae bacterium]HOM50409.1 hypothetical protein [Phycisphaerae bacterium]HON65695.1 hypothetical protein [Phycisphaerae bacterium]HOQ84179.1 hypothetical protein [Phycisphaerae bacterium]
MGAYGRGGADTEFDRSGRLAGEGSLARPIGDRASPTQVGDFLGLSQPLQSGRGFTGLAEGRPGTGDLGRAAGREPWQSGDFARPGQPGTFRPGQPGEATWPGKGGSGTERFPNLRLNNAINQRPGWANLDPARANSIQNNWRSAVVNQPNMNRWQNIHPEQIQQYNRWGNNVRRNWDVNVNNFDWHGNVFGPDWWNHHYYPAGGWNYWNNVNRYNYAYWWGGTTWPVMTGWFAWPPTEVMTQPVYYDYGPGGNVTYRNNTVYVNEQPVGTSQEFAQTAAALATVPPPADPQQAAQTEWMPLGTFALSTDSRETTPSRLIQLAVNREGIISGTLYNTQTDQAQAVQGQVDKQTQRVAMRLGESQNVVLETGLYNLTQREAPALIHYGADKTENCLLVRLDAPKTAGAPAGAGNPARSAGTPAAAKS